MIYISKDKNPPILLENADTWTKELKDHITLYGGYAKIPKEIKDAMWSHYKHSGIKERLLVSSHYKCAFCETKVTLRLNILTPNLCIQILLLIEIIFASL